MAKSPEALCEKCLNHKTNLKSTSQMETLLFRLAKKTRLNIISDPSTTSLNVNPNDDLKHLRIRAKTKELIVSHDNDSIIAVIQQWMPYAI